ncbi:hypothetical protein BHM03_00007946 [Ensete ventricosum]|nr:hypothetical protein BHM03_00007946 [Ensete ventricosum]
MKASVLGTIGQGCVAFEWSKRLIQTFASGSGHLTASSDVYSFGVVLLELLTGKRPLDKSRPVKQRTLVDWAVPSLADKKKVLHIVDPRLAADCPQKDAQRIAKLACYCLDQNPKARPLMRDVVDYLEPLQIAV